MQFQRGAERLFGKLRRQVASRGWLAIAVLVLAQVTVTGPARGEDGYELWLRYQPLAPAARERLADAVTGIYAGNRASPVLQAATGELERGLSRLSGRAVALLDAPGPGAVVVGQPDGSGLAEALSPMLARVGPAVRAWWRDRAAKIYRRIPDFGGFLVKADSEGQPGPQQYGRTHAEGANMLAAALEPHAAGEGSTVARVVSGQVHGNALTGVAGVSNVGSSRDWTGAPFTQANWYAFGRLAWNPEASAADIAREWLAQTFNRDAGFATTVTDLMLRSREAVVDYMTPLGLAHLMGTGHHYGPAPWVDDLPRPDWNPVYYHRADVHGIGFDRTATGSNAVAQYAGPVATRFGDLRTVREEYLLWFHRLPWDYRMRSGATLWEELVARYDRGVREVEAMQESWAGLEPLVDPERFAKVARFLEVQLREARWWRDACIAYFRSASGLPLPPGTRPPAASLDFYRSLEFPYAPGN